MAWQDEKTINTGRPIRAVHFWVVCFLIRSSVWAQFVPSRTFPTNVIALVANVCRWLAPGHSSSALATSLSSIPSNVFILFRMIFTAIITAPSTEMANDELET